jgi:D-arabinose 1-dehydrogenase-like Zn-dependent alcohol dehydrogenase
MQLLACSRRFSLGYGIPNDMSEIRGFAGHATGAHLLPYRFEFGELLDDEVEVRISHCGVCHGDLRFECRKSSRARMSPPRLYTGITAYNTLCDPDVRPSCRVRIIGIGGLEQIELQFACLFGADVTAFSTSNDKEDEAGRLRANHLVYTLKTNAMKKVAGSFDFLLSTFTADQNWQSYVNALRPNGTFCFVGALPSPATLHIFPLVSGQRSVVRQLNGKPK